MRRRSGALGVVLALMVAGVIAALPAQSQTEACPISSSYLSTGSGPPTTLGDTDRIGFTQHSQSSVTVVVLDPDVEVCDILVQFYNPSTQDTTGTQIEGDVPPGGRTITAPEGYYIQGIVVRARAVVTTTTTTSTTTTTTPGATTTTAPTTTTTSTSTTTTTSTTVPPRGPGIGPVSIRPAPVAQSSPDAAAVRGNVRLDVVVRGGEGANSTVWWSHEVYPDVPWTEYQDLGAPPGGLKGNPAIASWSPGRLDVFVRGADDKLWQNFSENAGQTWSGWLKPFGDDGTLTASPELATRGHNRLNVFVVNVDGDVYEHFYEGPEFGWNQGWVYHGKPPGGLFSPATGQYSDPGSVAWGASERVDLFARGADNRLWQKFYDGSGWSEWFKPVGDAALGNSPDLNSEPEAASWEPGNLLVFAIGTDGGAYALPFGTGGWGGWIRLVRPTDTWLSGPGATSRGLNSFDLFTRGTDDLVYHIWQ